MEFATAVTGAVVAEGVKESGKAALRQIVDYCFRFNSLVEELGKEKKMLTEHKQSVDEDVKIAEGNAENIDVVVQRWLTEAKTLIEKADLLEEKAKQACCLEGCPTWIWRYRLGKQIAKLIGNIKEQIRRKTELGTVGRIKALEGMRHPQNFQLFNCTKSAYNGLLKALKEDKHKIGLWGMGGSGKTTLVKQLGAEVQAQIPKLFDKVVFVVVSSNVDVKKIQGEIADQLGLQMEEQHEPARAERLSIRLKQGQKILIILDDLWKEIHLQDIGIPIGEDCNNCTVLLTTRRQGVCSLMDCQGTVSLELLDEAEAWRLFQIHAGLSDDTADAWKLDLGKKISKECGGLPVAIAALSRSLKGNRKVIWDYSLSALENSELVDIPETFQENENPYKCLKLSYDNLEDPKARSLFFLCSLFPEDSKIINEDLVRLASGLDVFENVNSCKRMRIMVDTAIDKLIDSCLLLQAEDGQSVKMHDWIRDVALSIAEKQIQLVMGPDDLKALAEDAHARNTVTKLYCNGIDEFPDQLACPNLEILHAGSAMLSDAFLVRVKGLKVLTSKSGFCQQLGQSIQELRNLRSLCLRGCRVKDLCFLLQMNKLILLGVSDCEMGGNPFEVLGSCSQLQELYFMKNSILTEDNKHIDVELAVTWFHRMVWSPALQRYHLDFGITNTRLFRDDDIQLRSRLFSIFRFDASTADTRVKDLMERAELLILERIENGCKNIIPDIGVAVDNLNELWIVESYQIECVIDNTTHSGQVGIAAFSKLVKLRIMFMNSMKAMCRGPPPHGLFEKLEFLEIKSCLKLRFLFTDAVAKSLIMLAELRIENCNALQCLIGDEEEEEEEEIISADGRQVFPKLKLLHVYRCHRLEYLVPVSYARGLQQLEDLSINWADSLRHIFGESNQNQNKFHIIDLPVLKRLHLEYLPNIRSICPTNCCPKWPLLDKLDLRNCQPRLHDFMPIDIFVAGSLWSQSTVTKHLREGAATLVQNLESLNIFFSKVEGIFSFQDEVPITGRVDSRLIELSLTCFPELRYIWLSANYALNLQKLEKVQIDRCEKLKAIFPSNVLTSLLQLKELLITDCNELEQMVEREKENQYMVNPREPRYILIGAHYNMDLQNLQVLKIEGCGKLNAVFSSSTLGSLQQLKELWIVNCESLVHITQEDGENKKLSLSKSGQLRFPQLTTVVVQGCHKLRSVFSISTSQELPKLRNLLIVEASELEEVFRRQHDTVEQVRDLLPELKIVVLVELESLTHVCQGFQLQSVSYRFVHHCSNLFFTPPANQPSLKDLVDKAYRDGHMVLSDLIRGVEYKIKPSTIDPTIEGIESESAFDEDSETRERILEDTEEDEDFETTERIHEYTKEDEDTEEDENTEEDEDPELDTQEDEDIEENEDTQINEELDKEVSSAQDNNEREEEMVGEDPALEKPATAISTADSKLRRPSTSPLLKEIVPEDPTPTLEDAGIAALSSNSELGRPRASPSVVPLYQAYSQEMVDPQSILREAVVQYQQQAVGKITVEAAQKTNIPYDDSIEATVKERVQEGPTLEGPTLSADLTTRNAPSGPSVTPLQETCSLELLRKSETIVTHQLALGEATPEKHSNALSVIETGSPFKSSTSKELKPFNSTEVPSSSISPPLVYSQSRPSTLEEIVNNVEFPCSESLALPSSLSTVKTSNITKDDVEHLADFHGLVKLDARRALLLDKAFAKYPHLWEWRKCTRSTKYCKLGYECLADMLVFLKTKAAKAMDESTQQEFQKLYDDLEPFGFDSRWLASIYQRVINAQVHDEMLNEFRKLESVKSNLEEVLDNVRVKMVKMKDHLSEYDSEFDL